MLKKVSSLLCHIMYELTNTCARARCTLHASTPPSLLPPPPFLSRVAPGFYTPETRETLRCTFPFVEVSGKK
jgi:hypothetical protein